MKENLKERILKNSLLFTTFIEALPFNKYGMEEFQNDEKWLIEHIQKKWIPSP